MQKLTTFLTFAEHAEQAAKFYVSIFKPSKILKTTRYREAGPGAKGSVMTVHFKLAGQEYVALNGGEHFKMSDAVSLLVNCDSQQEIDTYWRKLADGGQGDRVRLAAGPVRRLLAGRAVEPRPTHERPGARGHEARHGRGHDDEEARLRRDAARARRGRRAVTGTTAGNAEGAPVRMPGRLRVLHET